MLYLPFFTSSSSTQRPPDRESVYLKARQAWRAERWRERVRKDEGAEIKINLHHQFIRLVLLRLPVPRTTRWEVNNVISFVRLLLSPREQWEMNSELPARIIASISGRRGAWAAAVVKNELISSSFTYACITINFLYSDAERRTFGGKFIRGLDTSKPSDSSRVFVSFSWELKSSFCQIFRVEKYSIVSSPPTLP